MHIALLLELPRTSAFLLAQPVSLKDNLFSSISAITSDPLQLPHSCLFHNFQFVNLLPRRKHPSVCQAELHVPPDRRGNFT